jgi:phospholipid-translocating ATPase
MSLKKAIIIDDELDDLKQKEKMDFIKNISSLETVLETGKKENIKNFVKALAICHNVTPIKDDNEKGETSYQASSPDEIAFVKYADIHGIELNCRTENSLWLKLRKNDIEKYVVLDVFPFSSTTKRMGIIIQHPKAGKIYFYVKGAEDVMKDKIHSSFQEKFVEDCEKLAREGLRTLIFAFKEITEKSYRDWKKRYDHAVCSLDDRDRQIRLVIDELEVDLQFLGVTGVEDKLQKDVGKTIKDLRSAGITIWVLTGDKVETAQCIATTTELKTRTEDWFEIMDLKQEEVEKKLSDLSKRNLQRTVLVIDGASVARIMSNNPKRFLEFMIKAAAVVCCRIAPTQKTQIVELLKNNTQKRICSIGDGGNDVGMIQAAHVGIGIEGKEGKQASLAADFSIEEFSALRSLILCHGRHSYKRTAKLSNFVFHRGVIISVIQALFSCMFYFNAIPIYNGILMMGYATFYTNMPVFSIVLDQDATLSTLMVFPQLYLSLRRSKAISFKSFCICIFKSAYQGSAIIVTGVLLFPENNFTNIVSITFTALIFTELLNVMTEIDRFHWAMGISQVITGIIYLLSMFALKNYFDLNYLFSLEFLIRVLAITLISWMPLHLIKVLMTFIDPADYRKVETS